VKIYAARQREFNWANYAGKDLWVKISKFNFILLITMEYWVRANSVYTDVSGDTILRCNTVPSDKDFLTSQAVERACTLDQELSISSLHVVKPLEVMDTDELLEMSQ
jgi:hypothetical protein